MEPFLVTNNSASDEYPAWSPDGTMIAFHSYRDGNGEIYVMNADGSNQTNLTNNSASDLYPAWSPDGINIAFTSNREALLCREIYVMNADGSNQRRLTADPVQGAMLKWCCLIPLTKESTPRGDLSFVLAFVILVAFLLLIILFKHRKAYSH